MKAVETQQTEADVSDHRRAGNPAIMTAYEAAELASLSHRTIVRLCANGTIPAVKIGYQWRINREKFMKLMGLA